VLDRQLQFELEQSLDRSAPGAVVRANEMLDQSLFQRLFESLKRRHEAGEACRTVTLDEQFRMHPRLGRFVSDEFYEKNGEAFESPLDASHFAHALPGYPGPAGWIDVPRDRGFEKRGQSKSRPAEAEVIVGELRRLIDSEAGRALNFGIITFYSAQVDAIDGALRQAGFVDAAGQIVETYRDLVRDGGKRVERLRYGTVDAFQGMEFDVVLLSMVRSNDLPDGDEPARRRKYGHLMSPNRLCVSMSRQMRLLIVAGDTAMLREPGAAEAIGPLVRFERLCHELGGRRV
jgi:superfamily I DNA and/or RNA helicase